jgi:hypothetical protein
MKKIYTKTFSFVLSVITRWDTHAALIHSVLQVRNAIQAYFESLLVDPSNIFYLLAPTIADSQFWKNLTTLNSIIQPVDQAIRMSESDSSVLPYVIPRWKKVLVSIEEAINKSSLGIEERH